MYCSTPALFITHSERKKNSQELDDPNTWGILGISRRSSPFTRIPFQHNQSAARKLAGTLLTVDAWVARDRRLFHCPASRKKHILYFILRRQASKHQDFEELQSCHAIWCAHSYNISMSFCHGYPWCFLHVCLHAVPSGLPCKHRHASGQGRGWHLPAKDALEPCREHQLLHTPLAPLPFASNEE